MARTGSFGRLPRVAPNLSSTILAMLREYNSTIDSNMVDAWNNGGTVDGKPVTDARLLAHFKMRRDAISKDDPLWSMWNERIQQYTYVIEESKMTVLWDNGKASTSQMAAFYKKWMKKTPVDSQFGRTLASAYGKWMKSGAARSGGGGAAARAAAHDKWAMSYFKTNVNPVYTATSWLTNLVKDLGASGGMGATGDLSKTEAGSFDEFETLLAVVEGGGLPRSQQDLVDNYVIEMKKIDPTFTLSIDWFTTHAAKAKTAVAYLVSHARTKTEANQWGDLGTGIQLSVNRIKSAPIVADYKEFREQYYRALDAAQGDPVKMHAATAKYQAQVSGLMDKFGHKVFKDPTADRAVFDALASENNVLLHSLNGEQITGNIAPTILDSTGGGSAKSGTDAKTLGDLMNYMNTSLDRVAGGGWAEIRPVSGGVPGDVEYVIHDAKEPPPKGGELIPGLDLAGGVPVYGMPQPVMMEVRGPLGDTGAKAIKTDAAGNPLDINGVVILPGEERDADGNVRYVPATDIGMFTVTIPDADGDVVLYKGVTKDGVPFFTPDPPINPETPNTSIRTADGRWVVQIDKSAADVAGGFFSAYGHLSYAANGEYVAEPPVTKDANGKVQAGPGYFLTPAGGYLYAKLVSLKPTDPDFKAKSDAILQQGKALETNITRQWMIASKTGDGAVVAALGKTLGDTKSDWKNLMIAAVAVKSGDPSSLGQAKVADTWVKSDVDWSSQTGVTVNRVYSADDVALAATQVQAQSALSRYEATMGISQFLQKGLGYPTTSEQTSQMASVPALRSQIESATSASDIKLPGFVTDIANPYLPAPKTTDPWDAIRNNPDPKNPYRVPASTSLKPSTGPVLPSALGSIEGALKPTPPKPAAPPIPHQVAPEPVPPPPPVPIPPPIMPIDYGDRYVGKPIPTG